MDEEIAVDMPSLQVLRPGRIVVALGRAEVPVKRISALSFMERLLVC